MKLPADKHMYREVSVALTIILVGLSLGLEVTAKYMGKCVGKQPLQKKIG